MKLKVSLKDTFHLDTKRNIVHKLRVLIYVPFFVGMAFLINKTGMAFDNQFAKSIGGVAFIVGGIAIAVTILYIIFPTIDRNSKPRN